MTVGKFITFEGGEGTGKSTQTNLLADKLSAQNIECVKTREPGGSPAAEAIRELLLGQALGPITPLTEALLFSAARADHIDKTISPNLRAGRWVLSDRFMDSTRAYQGLDHAISQQAVEQLEQLVVADHKPDLTILLDLPANEGMERANIRHQASQNGSDLRDRFEARDIEFHKALREKFLQIAEANPERFAVIDASKREQDVATDVWNAVQKRLLS